jgi:hypothetical protein
MKEEGLKNWNWRENYRKYGLVQMDYWKELNIKGDIEIAVWKFRERRSAYNPSWV